LFCQYPLINYLTFNKEIQDDLKPEPQVSKEPTSDSTDDVIIDFIDDDIINVQNSVEVMNHLDQPDNIEIQNDIKPEIQIEKEMLVPTTDSIGDDKGQKI
jgi:hypothetical protein